MCGGDSIYIYLSHPRHTPGQCAHYATLTFDVCNMQPNVCATHITVSNVLDTHTLTTHVLDTHILMCSTLTSH